MKSQHVKDEIDMKLTASISKDPSFEGKVQDIHPLTRRTFLKNEEQSAKDVCVRNIRTHLPLTRTIEMVTIALTDAHRHSYGNCSNVTQQNNEKSSSTTTTTSYKVSQVKFDPKICRWTAKVDFSSQIQHGYFHLLVDCHVVVLSSDCSDFDMDEDESDTFDHDIHHSIDVQMVLPQDHKDRVLKGDKLMFKAMLVALNNISLDISRQLLLHSLPSFPEGCGNKKFQSIYQLNAKLKSGSFATVCRATHRASKRYVAVKCIQRRKLSPTDDVAIISEVDILTSIKHERICPLFDFFIEPDHYFIVIEYMEGGDVFDRIGKLKNYNEEVARNLVFKMLQALEYLHQNNIAHCDLKPKNLLLRTVDNDESVVLADFGFASRFYSPNSLNKQCGTPYFVAPEILLRKGYDSQADMWSVGAIIYSLLSGNLPFVGARHIDLFKAIISGKFTFDDEIWKYVSNEAKDLVRNLLVVDPAKRYTALDAINSAWIMKDRRDLRQMTLLNTSGRMKTFNARLTFKTAILVTQSVTRWKRIVQNKDRDTKDVIMEDIHE
jgi:serine/threonine protein kinase